MPQDTKSKTPFEADGFGQGQSYEASDPARLSAALDAAFDYRGDVTLTLAPTAAEPNGRTVEGYIYDRRRGPEPGLRLLVRDADERLDVTDDAIARLEVTGKDTAAGRSFESWIKRYVEKKLAGEEASLHGDEV